MSESPPSLPPSGPTGSPSAPRPPSAHVAGKPIPTADERSMGMLIHLLAILTGFLGPLILWLVRRESSRFIDHNGKEAINFQISLLIYFLGLSLAGGLLALATMGLALIVIVPIAIVLPILALVFEILSCVKAYQGEWPSYPLTIRLIR